MVGTLPPSLAVDEDTAMRWILEQAGPVALTGLPADRDSNWIIGYLRNLTNVAVLEVVVPGEFRDYDDFTVYRVARRRCLAPGDVTLGRVAEVDAAMVAHRHLATEHPGLPPHQVSIPSPLDLAAFVFGVPAALTGLLSRRHAVAAVRAALAHLPTFTTAVVNEIRAIHDRWGDQVAFQVETPAVCVSYDRAPRSLWPVATGFLTSVTARVLEAIPADALVIVHDYCHGDYMNKPIADPGTLLPLVAFRNRIAARLRAGGRTIPPMHAALCDGVTPPSLDPEFYKPLNRLDPDIPFYAGVVDEQHPAETAAALRLTEAALGRPVNAVAAPCGLGRRDPERAAANMRLARELALTPTEATP
ncbi:hypothetical protein [Amycolatopsis sp. GM8]|uniref:hypothetical protein n=1 Tax=Amycolatopsis sp. GM8 TaxID=2896530 RepID=UPI001F404034|nr:hypothetical protein [Amycolatopsis sp. GM8]